MSRVVELFTNNTLFENNVLQSTVMIENDLHNLDKSIVYRTSLRFSQCIVLLICILVL